MPESAVFPLLFLCLLLFSVVGQAAKPRPSPASLFAQSLALVTPTPVVLPYHGGPLLSGPDGVAVYLIWYGNFTASQRSIAADFIHSFHTTTGGGKPPSVESWWSVTGNYKDAAGTPVSAGFRLAGQTSDDSYSRGKSLHTADLEGLVKDAVKQKTFPATVWAVYMVLTSDDVYVDGFCMDSCGYHAYTFPSEETGERMLTYAWVGNAAKQCPGQCAWPFAVPMYGPPNPPLQPPNADVGIDGMIINIATVLAGAATNPYDTGYFQGDASTPLEAVSACTGIFGTGAFPGYPGRLLVHNASGGSYNAHGVNGRTFLIPAIWNPDTLSCLPLL